MSDLGFNKIAFCVLGTGLALIGLNEAAHAMFHVEHHAKAGYDIPIETAGAGEKAVVEGPVDYNLLISTADITKGKEQAGKCLQCHHLGKGEGISQGPELYGVVGRDIASFPGMKYSTGSGSLSAMEGVWDIEKLDHFISSPKKMSPGTAMNFAGINSKITGKQDRANLIAYLRTLTDGAPFPLPPPLPAGGAAPAPAEGAAPAATPQAEGTPPAPAPAPAAPH